MTLQHARVIKAAFPEQRANDPAGRQLDPTRFGDVSPVPVPRGAAAPARETAEVARARRIAGEILAARAEAERIVADARQQAEAVVAEAAAAAAAEAREKEVARLAAGFLALRDEEARRAERDVDRVIELAVLLAERLVGEAIRVEPARIAELAASAIQEARGARRVRIDASPDDVVALTEALGAIGHTAEVQPDATLHRGSLVVHTDLGRIDARLEPQLARLAAALREALR
jgi:flagellar assembly protein FliH/type III secretion protein L